MEPGTQIPCCVSSPVLVIKLPARTPYRWLTACGTVLHHRVEHPSKVGEQSYHAVLAKLYLLIIGAVGQRTPSWYHGWFIIYNFRMAKLHPEGLLIIGPLSAPPPSKPAALDLDHTAGRSVRLSTHLPGPSAGRT